MIALALPLGLVVALGAFGRALGGVGAFLPTIGGVLELAVLPHATGLVGRQREAAPVELLCRAVFWRAVQPRWSFQAGQHIWKVSSSSGTGQDLSGWFFWRFSGVHGSCP